MLLIRQSYSKNRIGHCDSVILYRPIINMPWIIYLESSTSFSSCLFALKSRKFWSIFLIDCYHESKQVVGQDVLSQWNMYIHCVTKLWCRPRILGGLHINSKILDGTEDHRTEFKNKTRILSIKNYFRREAWHRLLQLTSFKTISIHHAWLTK